MRRKIIIVAALIAMLVTSVSVVSAKDSSRIRTTVAFTYSLSSDKSEVIPTVTVTSQDYSTGSAQQQSYSFPNQKISIPANASYNEMDTSKPESLRTSCGSYTGTYHFQMSSGLKAYQVDCYSVYNNKTGNRTQPKHSRILEFDLKTKKLRVLRSVDSDSEYTGYVGLEMYRNFKGYAVKTDEKAVAHEDYSSKKVQVYSLETNKPIAVLNDYPREESINPLTGNYDKILDIQAVVIQEYELLKGNAANYGYSISYAGKSYLVKNYQLYADGRKTELFGNKNIATKRWEKKIGSLRYAYYYDSKKKAWFVGYSKGGSYFPLSESSAMAIASFSPNDKYLLISNYFTDPKTRKRTGKYTTTVVDTSTAKVLHVLPAFEEYNRDHGFQWISDDLVYVRFNNPNYSGYLHVPTGILTKHEGERYYDNASLYSGSYSNLLTPESPYEILIDGRNVSYSTQGPFHLYKGEEQWMIPLDDFARGIGAAVKTTKSGWQVSQNNQVLDISREKAVIFRNQAFVPFASLTENLGIVAAIEVNYKLLLFTNQITEEQLKVAFPKATLVDYDFKALIDGKLTSLDESTREVYHMYRVEGETLVLFQNGHLVSVIGASYPSKTARGVELHEGKGKNAMLKKYGTVKPKKDGEMQLYTYKMNDYDMTFATGNDLVKAVYFTFHNQE
ncbi:hypothetical protein [Cohnella abietis]|uniref:Copper amine oxidase-like N-terminal domain-containing protein n=1 Tax=Cohnella abietis TaxID=2507935 RepID=A0A3T1CZK5_9BACL|nr:hypothetical protein [Cohnella abietis]BBI31297.1 hypothetical protein KCTCHS21_06960 [Cohnella abietis]